MSPHKKENISGEGGRKLAESERNLVLEKNAALRRTPHLTESRERCSDPQEMRKLAYRGPLSTHCIKMH